MLKKILIAVAAIIAVLLIVVAVQPGEFRVARSTTISAPPPVVFEQVNDLRKWAAWNPWGKIDPAIKQSYEGPPSGTGAIYKWAGNKEVGEGRMTITESLPDERVRFSLEFFKPMAGTSTTEFTFKPQGNQTEVTWTMTGKNNFIGKAMCLFMSMDKMIGQQFEKGLADMRAIAEAAGKS